MTNLPQGICAALEQIAGQNNVFCQSKDMASFLEEPRKRFHTPAQAVVTPRDVKTLQSIVAWANAEKTPLIPQGGNTGLVGGQVPRFGDEIIVSLKHLNKVREIDVKSGHMDVEAGLTLQAAQEAAQEAGLLFPLSIASQGSATIGGVLSTNAGGVHVLAYGNARQLCLGVEAVMADGTLYRGLNALKKDNTGYDLRDLLIGAEGTLGFIVAATLKLYPRAHDYETAWINVASPEVALHLFGLLKDRAGSALTAFELMPRFGLDIQLKHKMLAKDPSASFSPWYVLAEVSIAKGASGDILSNGLEAALAAHIIDDATLAASGQARNNMWAAREQMSPSQSREGASIKHDVSVPVSAVPELIARGSKAAKAIIAGIRPCPFGHMGDGNIHFNFSQPLAMDPKVFMDGAAPLHEAIYQIVTELGGSVSAEHGIGQLKVDLLKKLKDPVALAMMGKIKQALDPNNILNPGKILAE
ncbi:D-2-hydroxyglutarate dehydrogenase [hydrothermal vent metagenome]|uniref:D-2-hydroxyglutarate dehydrogenase n=1 Tax=hydrothermal vent metagenome TaxID=652676 RepID=A0A3B0UTX0_9ZZZZ